MQNLETIAQNIYQAEIDKKTIPPIRTLLSSEEDIGSAYRIQQLITQKKLKNGAVIIGKKIGLTSTAIQKQLGVDQPDFGILTNNMLIKNHGEISSYELMQPKAEGEWAFILKEDLNQDQIEMSDVVNAIDYALVAIEIVGSRIENWNIKITDTIADNASASHFVMSQTPIPLEKIDLLNCKLKVYENDKLVSSGYGKDCMGNPLNAVLWLARTMYKQHTPLLKGEIILSGALGPMVNLSQGDHITAQIDDFEKVEFRVV